MEALSPLEHSVSSLNGSPNCFSLRPLSDPYATTRSTSFQSSSVVSVNLPTMSRRGVLFYIKLTLSVIGVLAGLSVFAAFFFWFKNYHAALWGFASGLFATAVLHLHILYMLERLERWHDETSLEGIKILGLIVSCLSFIASGTYLAFGICKHQGFVLEDMGFYPAAIFSFLTWKWGFLLFWNARQYQRIVQLNNPALLAGVRMHPDSDNDV